MIHQALKRLLPFVLVSLFTVSPLTQAAITTTIDFDAVGVSSTTGMGDPTSYLSGFGVSMSQTHSSLNPLWPQLVAVDDRYMYTGWDGTGADPALYLQAPSAHNVFYQAGDNGPITFTFQFASPLSSFSFDSVGIGPAPQSTSFPAWAAEAYDASGNLLDSVSQSFDVNRTTSAFTLSAADYLIDHVTFYRDGTRGTGHTNWTAYSQVIIDDLVLTQADIPEPTTLIIWSLLGALGIVYGWRRRKAA